MHISRAPALLVLLTLLIAPASARAQVDPDRPRGPGGDALDALRAAAPAARLSFRDGHVRVASGMHVEVPGATPEERAERFLRHFGRAFGAGPGVDLRVERVQRAHGFTVVRFRRHAFGVPVLLRSVIVRAAPDGAIDLVIAAPGPERVDAAPATVSAGSVAVDAAGRIPSWPSARAAETRAVGLPLGDAIVRGWAVDVEGAHLHQRALLVYDRDGRLIVGVPRASHALGRVYDPNPVVAMEATSDLELSHLTSRERLTGRYVRSSSCGSSGSSCTPSQTAIADEDGNFLFDPEEPVFDDEFAEVSGYFHADRAAEHFREMHGFTWSCCGGTTVMEVVVNYAETPGMAYDNAAYAPSSCSRSACGTILLGQGRGKDFSYDGDVVYHEYTHSVVDETAGIVGFDLDDLGISYEPLGINEGTADYFAATIAGDPRIAEYFSGTGGFATPGSLREIDGDTRCPEDLFGEGHLDGRVWSGALWSVREALGAEKTDALVYTTLLSMVDNTVFDDAAELLVGTAMGMAGAGMLEEGEVAVVEEAVAAKGLAGCRRIVPLDDQEDHDGYSGTDFATGSVGGSVVPLHYSLDVPADTTRVTLHLERRTAAGAYTYYFRNDEPLRFVASRRPPLLHDTAIEGAATVELTDGGEHPLPRCGTLYLALIAEDLNEAGESVYRLRAEVERSGDPDAPCATAGEDAGPAATADGGRATDAMPARRWTPGGGGGCGCVTAGAEPPGGSAWLLPILAGLAVHWRLRRRGPK